MDTPTGAEVTRRQVLLGIGGAGLVAALGGAFLLPGQLLAMPNAEGFLLVDLKKCQSCGTCMMACSLAHTGKVSHSLGRIQIQQDSFANWPDDVFMAVCHQCEKAPCVQACPVAANRPDPVHGQVRTIDANRCIGCQQCIEACLYTPKRVQWDPVVRKAQKCDLCVDTPFLGEKGGPGGTQACVKVCPVNCISFVPTMPDQTTEAAYHVNLRGPGWALLGMTTE